MQSFNLYVYSLMALRQHNSAASHTKTNGYAGIFGDRLVLAFFLLSTTSNQFTSFYFEIQSCQLVTFLVSKCTVSYIMLFYST